MLVHVLLYQAGKDSEGIHSLELAGKTVVLMFENKDDAERYCLLLEAQDFPCPTVENIEREEIESFCSEAGYEAKFVETGFIPRTDEDRLLLVPPQANLDVSSWDKIDGSNQQTNSSITEDETSIDDLRKRLEGLL